MKKILSFAALAMVAATSLAQVDQNRVVATINGEEIKGNEYYRRMEYLPNVGKMMGKSFAQFPPGFLTLEQLITERLVMQLAKKNGVMPTDAEIQQEIRYMQEENPKLLEEFNGSTGKTRADLEYEVKFSLAQFKLVTQGVTVTDQEVEQHYTKNKIDLYTAPRRAKLRVIAVSTEQEQTAVDAELKSGKKFEDVVKTHSQDMVTKNSGGDYGFLPIDSLPEAVKKAVDSTKAGEMTSWIEISGSRLKFLIEQKQAPTTEPLDDRLKRYIRRRLMQDKGVVKNKIGEQMNQMRKDANIDIKSKDFAEAYKKFIEAFLRENGG